MFLVFSVSGGIRNFFVTNCTTRGRKG